MNHFTKAQRVRYVGSLARRSGQFGTVKQLVKSRNVVTIEWDDDGSWFDARPENLEAV